MAKHALSLEIIPTLNCSILRVQDTSHYSEGMPITCPTLHITLPGFESATEIIAPDIAPNFCVNLNACNLHVQATDCDQDLNILPDGIYVVTYSVAPNDVVYVEYNHLRMCKVMNVYDKILCELDLSDCEPDVETAKKMKVLREIKTYLEAAKAKVEICHEPKKGMELFTYAQKLLNRFNCKTCY